MHRSAEIAVLLGLALLASAYWLSFRVARRLAVSTRAPTGYYH